MEVEDLASDDDDFLEQEDDELAAEGARILAEIEAEQGAQQAANKTNEEDKEEDPSAEIARVRKLGYNSDDYEIESKAYEDCVHETVYPRGYDR